MRGVRTLLTYLIPVVGGLAYSVAVGGSPLDSVGAYALFAAFIVVAVLIAIPVKFGPFLRAPR